MRITFRGGVHPNEKKELSRDAALREFRPAGEMVFPLSQHIGKPAKPVVKKGDEVRCGQLIAEADGFVSANIHSSCSGTVKAVEKRRTIAGTLQECIVVENDGCFTPDQGIGEEEKWDSLPGEEILARVKAAGIVGLGGAGFPTHVKLAPKDPSKIRFVIANGAECEPYLTCNDQLMRTCAPGIVEGLEITLRLFPNAEGVICLEDNKPEAAEALRAAAAGKDRISVRVLRTKYPQGGERSLIRVIAGVDFPTAMLPADVGCIVNNVGTLYAITRAVRFREPLIRTVVTLTGEAAANPGNWWVPIGTRVSELLEAAGGLKNGMPPKKVLAGGPMMGFAMTSLDVPTVKTTNGVTLLAEDPAETAAEKMTACLHCGRCTTVCPLGLTPQLMADAAYDQDYERYEKKLYGLDCISCGSCTYICPAKRPLTQTFKQTKAEILALRRAAK